MGRLMLAELLHCGADLDVGPGCPEREFDEFVVVRREELGDGQPDKLLMRRRQARRIFIFSGELVLEELDVGLLADCTAKELGAVEVVVVLEEPFVAALSCLSSSRSRRSRFIRSIRSGQDGKRPSSKGFGRSKEARPKNRPTPKDRPAPRKIRTLALSLPI
jgi:hypothetical protein